MLSALAYDRGVFAGAVYAGIKTYGEDKLDLGIVASTRPATCAAMFTRNKVRAAAIMVSELHVRNGSSRAIIVNAGAFTHYAWALHDALAAFEGPKIELHLSNPAAREPWRHTSVLAPVVSGSIVGFKGLGYELAVQAVGRLL